MAEKKADWKAPSHYKLVKEKVVPDDGKRYVVSHGNVYELDYSDPGYQKWAKERAEKKRERLAKRVARVKELAEKKATRLALKQIRKEKTAKVKEINAQIAALRAAKKKA